MHDEDLVDLVLALAACRGQVKPAVLVVKGLNPREADQALRESGGNLRSALAGLGRGAKREGTTRRTRAKT